MYFGKNNNFVDVKFYLELATINDLIKEQFATMFYSVYILGPISLLERVFFSFS